jgi:hypothetical protein
MLSSVKVVNDGSCPEDTKLRAEYASFAEIEAVCQSFIDEA